jgi:phosphatidate cytidylyltransferase
MKRVLTAVVLVPLVLLAVFKAPSWLFAVLVAGVIVLALREYLNVARAAGLKPFQWLTYAAGVIPIPLYLYSRWRGHDLPFESSFLLSTNWERLIAVAAVIFGLPLVLRKDLKGGLADVAASFFGVIYIGVSLSLLITLRLDFEPLLIAVILFSVWAGDIAAYYVGRSIGRRKLAPVVSPNKSWEGAIASVVASVAVTFLMLHFRPEIYDSLFRLEGVDPHHRAVFKEFGARSIGSVHIVALGILTNVAAQFGDLFESALKRGAGVKDSGTLLPGHGGVLDRIDALLFAIPVVWYYATQTGLLMKLQD